MKKLICVILSLITICAVLCACNNTDNSSGEPRGYFWGEVDKSIGQRPVNDFSVIVPGKTKSSELGPLFGEPNYMFSTEKTRNGFGYHTSDRYNVEIYFDDKYIDVTDTESEIVRAMQVYMVEQIDGAEVTHYYKFVEENGKKVLKETRTETVDTTP